MKLTWMKLPWNVFAIAMMLSAPVFSSASTAALAPEYRVHISAPNGHSADVMYSFSEGQFFEYLRVGADGEKKLISAGIYQVSGRTVRVERACSPGKPVVMRYDSSFLYVGPKTRAARTDRAASQLASCQDCCTDCCVDCCFECDCPECVDLTDDQWVQIQMMPGANCCGLCRLVHSWLHIENLNPGCCMGWCCGQLGWCE